MSLSTLPADASSLLVPIHLDAWVVDSPNQQEVAVYTADYMRLKQFKSPVPEKPDTAGPKPGVYLHWALPDPLTHGKSSASDNSFVFPHVPNRWLVLRFNTPPKGQWQCKLWVVESDYLGSALGATKGKILGENITSIPLAAGATEAVSKGTTITIIDPNGSSRPVLTVAVPVKAGDTSITIDAYTFQKAVTPGSQVQLVAASAYLDPFKQTSMKAAPGSATAFDINAVNIGRNYTIDAWEANTDAEGQTYLTAVGPGNIAFSAYTPFTKDVCSFTDNSLPADGTGVHYFTYMIVGWYSNTTDDPMNGMLQYKQGIWESVDQWKAQTPAQRFNTLLNYYKWSVTGDAGATPPSTSLYHGLVASLQWPYRGGGGDAGIGTPTIAVANTAADALATLVQAQASAQAKDFPKDADAWIAAGNTLALLIQAAMYDQLSEYGKPGSDVLLRQKIEQSWYGAQPGGTIWEVVSIMPQQSDDEAKGIELTPAQAAALNTQLAALNLQQSKHDEAVRQLHSQQESLYRMWLRIGMGGSFGWGEAPETIPPWNILWPLISQKIYPGLIQQVWDQHCIVNQADLPDSTNDDEANKWLNKHWTFPKTSGGGTCTPLALNIGIKASNAPRFWAPTDPVVMIAGLKRAKKFGEDGRYNKNGTLTCRLPAQTITGLQLAGKPPITGAGLNLMPYGNYKTIPSIPALVKEAFFADPANADLMAGTVSGVPAADIANAIKALLNGKSGNDRWIGTPPVPFAITAWQQAWSPLFLEWSLYYFPTGAGQKQSHVFSTNDWNFNGEKFVWKGTGFNRNYFVTYTGRTTLTPQASKLFSDKIAAYLKDHPDIDSQQLESLISTVAGWDILSQSLSGFTDQLITLRSNETFPPTPDGNMNIPCPGAGKPTPSVTALIGEQYHHSPMLEGTGSDVVFFYPVRGGMVQFSKLRVIDSFGQSRLLSKPNTGQGFLPLISRELLPSVSIPELPYGSFQLAPRIVQHTKLNMRLLCNDGSGKEITVSTNPSPVCGWLLPNHLDGGISVYDDKGILLGELLPLPAPGNWRPRPGDPGNNPPPATPSAIPNAALKATVSSIAAQPVTVFNDLLKVIDETLWMVDPLGGRKDQFLSVMIGRPLAIVQMSLQLQLEGDPATNQLWDKTAVNIAPPNQDPQYAWLKDIGEIEHVPFPVRLGSLELRNDGLIGYFLADGDKSYKTFYSVHTSPEINPADTYIKQIQNKTTYQGDISVACNREGVTVTMLVDPRGVVHAATGVLPVTTATLPEHVIENFIKTLQVTFITGPIIADPGTLRTPKPAEQQGQWNWIEAVPPPRNWQQSAIVNADDKARMPGGNLKLREGWLQLSGLDQNANNKS